MSRVLRLAQAVGVMILSAGCLSHSVAAAGDAQISADNAPVVVVGGFSNVRYTAEHAYGQQLRLWRQGERLLGLFKFTDGRQADFHTGLLEKVSFDAATGRLSFETYASQFRFDGTLEKEVVTGLLTRMHPTTGAQIAVDHVVLKRSPDVTERMRDYTSLEEWTRDAAEILKRLGPPDKSPQLKR